MSLKLFLSDPGMSIGTVAREAAAGLARRAAGPPWGEKLDVGLLMKTTRAVEEHMAETLMADRAGEGGARLLTFGGSDDFADYVGWLAAVVLPRLTAAAYNSTVLQLLTDELPGVLTGVLEPLHAGAAPAAPPPQT